jgi:hypothetical protein
VYVAGSTASIDFPTLAPLQFFTGTADGFLGKFGATRLRITLGLMAGGLLLCLAACGGGGGGSPSGANSGSYTVTVTGSDGTLIHTLPLTLTVN